MILLTNGRLQTRKPLGLGLQVSLGMDHEVSLPGARWRCGAEVPGAATRDREEQGNDHLRGFDQSGPRTYAYWYSASDIGFSGGPVSKGQEFAQAVIGVSEAEEAILGPTPMGEGLLGC